MTKILVCDPKYFNIMYEINPWMNLNNQVDRELAISQWHDLVDLLNEIGATVLTVPGQPGLPDMVFTANAGVVFAKTNQVVLSNFKYPERQKEKKYYREWFEANGFEAIEFSDDFHFEGAGDGLFDSTNLYLGFGFRSQYESITHSLWSNLFEGHIHHIKLKDPYFYHLDTCFCPLTDDYALVWTGAFDSYTLENCFDELNLLKVPEEDARKFACNAISIGNRVVIPAGCQATKNILEQAGFEVFDLNMSEFIKAGGACKCLTLKLD